MIAQHQNAFADLMSNFDEGTIQTFVQRLGGRGFRRIYKIGNNDALRTIAEVIELEKQGKITNFDDWVSFLTSGNKSNDQIQNLLVELKEARRVGNSIGEGEVVNVGGDQRVAENASGERGRSFDLTVENTNTGNVTRNIEVTTVEELVGDYADLTTGIRHAIEKRSSATGGTIEATIEIELATQVNRPGGVIRYINESGSYSDVQTRNQNRSYNNGNIFRDVTDNLPQIETGNASRIGDNPEVNLIDRVNITKMDGSLLATYVKENGVWKLRM